MVFIKGAWIELWPGDGRFHNYFCCPKKPLLCRMHSENNQSWVTVHCALTQDEREIPHDEEFFSHGRVIRPDWCPLRIKDP